MEWASWTPVLALFTVFAALALLASRSLRRAGASAAECVGLAFAVLVLPVVGVPLWLVRLVGLRRRAVRPAP